MNYYIQGDAANADKIKAAFERLGYDTSKHLFNAESVLYFTLNGEIMATTCNCTPAIIKTHPDYQELELPIQTKFKVGDRVILDGKVRTITFMDDTYYDFDGGVAGCRIELQDKLKPAHNFKKGDLLIHNSDPTFRVLVVDVSEKYGYQLQGGGSRFHLSFTTVENEYHLWTIADAKDGDVLVYPNEIYQDEIFLFNLVDNNIVLYHCCFDGNLVEHSFYGFSNEELLHVHPATKEQRNLLFAKMKEAGYEWDADKKKLRKIKQHYDIANFKAGMPVLVRADDKCVWDYSTFSRITRNENWQFAVCNGVCFTQCIPFNKDTKRLLGTTDMPSEEYINW